MIDRHTRPPRWADRFFQWYCNDELSETILGDLHERYQEIGKSKPRWKANILYWGMVLRFINRHTLQRRPQYYTNNQYAMFKNYFLITLRHLKHNPVFSAINIFGLALGLASCLIIFLHVTQELSFDAFHQNSDRIYRVTNTFERSSGSIHWARTPPALAPSIRAGISGIEGVTRLRYADDHIYSVGDRVFRQGNVFYADSMFLRIFSFPFVSGNPKTALSLPNSIVISEEMAIKYFGDENPLDQIITFDGERSLQVTGVFKNIPMNSHISFDMLLSFESFIVPDGYLADLNSWSWAGFHTYTLVERNADPARINDQIEALYNENFNRANISSSTSLQPLTDIYLESGKYTNVGESIKNGNRSTIYGLSVVAVLILLIAGFNFMNLSTAMSLKRGKEVGIRKVLGAVNGKIVSQFLVESLVVSCISFFIAAVVVFLSMPFFERNLGIAFPDLSDLLLLLPFGFGVACLIGLLAGYYPSIMLSSTGPIKALRGNLKTGRVGTAIRNLLVVIQFAISLTLISGSLIIVLQMDYLQSKSLGFDQENILKVKVSEDDMRNHYEALKTQFESHSQVQLVSMVSHGFDGGSSSGPARLVGTPEDQSYQLAYYQTDEYFLDLMDIELIEGRFFSEDFPRDSSSMLLNETAVSTMEIQDPIGKKMLFAGMERTIIGIVKDFHFNSLHVDIAPMAILKPFVSTEMLLVKIAPGQVSETLLILEQEWTEIIGNSPFEVSFLDDTIQRMYQQEQKLSNLIQLFTVLAIILACLGLYGLITFAVDSRLKEVGIRKVLGANIYELLFVLSKQYIVLTTIAIFIAVPLVYYVGIQWLDNFAYRMNLSWWIFILSGGFLILIAVTTISTQTIRAALSNPVGVLRNE